MNKWTHIKPGCGGESRGESWGGGGMLRDEVTSLCLEGEARGCSRKRLCFYYIQGDEVPSNEQQKRQTFCFPTERSTNLAVLGMESSVESY